MGKTGLTLILTEDILEGISNYTQHKPSMSLDVEDNEVLRNEIEASKKSETGRNMLDSLGKTLMLAISPHLLAKGKVLLTLTVEEENS